MQRWAQCLPSGGTVRQTFKISISLLWKWKWSRSVVPYSLRPHGPQAPLSVGFSRREYWSGLPCHPPEDLPNPGIEPESLESLALAGKGFTTRTTRKLLTPYDWLITDVSVWKLAIGIDFIYNIYHMIAICKLQWIAVWRLECWEQNMNETYQL